MVAGDQWQDGSIIAGVSRPSRNFSTTNGIGVSQRRTVANQITGAWDTVVVVIVASGPIKSPPFMDVPSLPPNEGADYP
jgi:hypothetical protein